MIKFKDILSRHPANRKLAAPQVSLSSLGFTLELAIDSREIITEAAYEGKKDIWLSALCELLPGKKITEVERLTIPDFLQNYQQEPLFCDLWFEREDELFFLPIEMVKAAVGKYQGREFLYREESPLICRCFGVREKDVLEYLNQEEHPTLAGLAAKTKAGMGCRSCKSQLERWMNFEGQRKGKRYFKERTYAEWLLLVEEALQGLPESGEWKLEVETMKANAVVISFSKNCSQREEEDFSRQLQGFLAGAVDSDLSFFLRRSRQR